MHTSGRGMEFPRPCRSITGCFPLHVSLGTSLRLPCQFQLKIRSLPTMKSTGHPHTFHAATSLPGAMSWGPNADTGPTRLNVSTRTCSHSGPPTLGLPARAERAHGVPVPGRAGPDERGTVRADHLPLGPAGPFSPMPPSLESRPAPRQVTNWLGEFLRKMDDAEECPGHQREAGPQARPRMPDAVAPVHHGDPPPDPMAVAASGLQQQAPITVTLTPEQAKWMPRWYLRGKVLSPDSAHPPWMSADEPAGRAGASIHAPAFPAQS